MNRREFLVTATGTTMVALSPVALAEHYLRVPYSPEVYARALARREPVLFSFYASW